MAANTRFATGVQILVLLASEPGSLQTSSTLAEHLNTNPVVVRRVLSSLQKAELIFSQKGPSGGSRLARPAKNISLSDVYAAVETTPLFYTTDVSSGLPGKVNVALAKTFTAARKCVSDKLGETTLAQLAKRSGRK